MKASFIDVAGNESNSVSVISGLQVTLAGTPPVLEPAFDAFNSYDSSSATYYSRNAKDSSDSARTLFTVAGTSMAGEELQIFNDVNLNGIVDSGEALLTVTADANGYYSAGLSLLSGSYQLRAVSVNADGSNSSSPSDVQKVVIDTAVPDSPTLNEGSTLAGDGRVGVAERDAGVALSGTGDPFATLNVQLVNLTTGVSGDIYRNVTVDAQGRWSTTIGVVQWGQVGSGEIEVRLSQSDRAGNTSAVYSTSEGFAPTLILDTAVATPGVFQLAGDNILNAAEAATSNVVRGSGEPGAQVALTFTGSNGAVGPVTLTVDEQGIWSYTLTSRDINNTLGNGLVAVDAVQTDLAGNVSAKGSRIITVDTLAFAPVIDVVAGDDKINLGERSLGVSVTGSAEAGASLRITLTGSTGQTVHKDIIAGDSGSWSVIFSETDFFSEAENRDLGQGPSTVSATQTDLAGNTSVTGVRNITIQTEPLKTPVVLNDVTVDNKVSVTEQDSGITLSGSAPASTTLFLTLSGKRGVITQSLLVGADGNWSLPLGTEALQSTLGAGEVNASAYAVDTAQQSTALLTGSFTIELAEPSPSVSRVASDNYVNALEAQAPVVIDGGGVAKHLVLLDITGQSGRLSKEATVDSDGKWSISLSVGDIAVLGEGAVTVKAQQKASTNASADATSIETTTSFTIDRTAPLAPSSSDTSIANTFNATQSDMAGGVTVIETADGVTVAVALPQDAVAGDRMTLRWGSQEIIQTITAAMLPAQGARVVYVPVSAAVLTSQGSGVFDVSVVFSDIAGNVASAQVLASSLSVQAPPAAPSINTVYADGYINAVEFSEIVSTGTGSLSGNATDGGTISLTLTGSDGSTVVINSIAVTGGAWTASFTSAQLSRLPQGTISATAVYTSASGATSAPSVMDFVFDKTAPLAPAASSATAVAAGEANARNELSGGLIRNNNSTTEAAQPVTVNVALASDVQSGDTLTLYWGTYQVNTVINQSDLSRGYAEVVVSAFVMSTVGDNNALVVDARVTDKAGNAGARYEVWTGKVDAIPLSPEVNAVSGDGYLNAAEAALGWAVTGQGVVGGKVVVTLLGTNLDANGNAVKLVSDEMMVVNSLDGIPEWRYVLTKADADFLGEGLIKITSIQYDESGNASDPGKNPSDPSIRYFTIDLQAPANPTVNSVTSDNRISYAESLADVTLSGTGESGANVSLTISGGTGTVTKNKSTTVVDGVWEVLLTPLELAEFGGGSITLTARQTDPAGNSSGTVTRTFLYSTDAVAPPAFTSVTGITPLTDTAFNVADLNALSALQPYTVSGTGTGGDQVRLTATNTDTGTVLTYLLDVGTDNIWRKTFTTDELSDLGQGKVNFSAVQISDLTGDESTATTFNTGTSDKSFLIDTIAPTLVSAVVTANGSNGNAKAGDVITVTVQASEGLVLSGLNAQTPPSLQLSLGNGQMRSASYDATLSAAAGSDKLIFTYTVVDGDSAVTVTSAQTLTLNGASLADLAANPVANSIASAPVKTLRVDTVAPGTPDITSVDAVATGTPGQMLDGSGNSVNKINASEAAAGVKVRVSLSGTNALEGDTVQLAWMVGTTTQTTTTLSKLLDSTAIGLGYVDVTVGSSSIGILDGSVTLTALLVDSAGNASGSTSQRVVLVDTAPPAQLAISTWMDDNKLNASEASSTDLSMRGTLLETGASVSATITQGSTIINLTAVADGTAGDWLISHAQLLSAATMLADGAFTVTLSQTDSAGNTGLSTTGSYYIDRSVPGQPSITSVPANEDGWINLRDAQTTGVTVLVSLQGTNAQTDDTLVLSGLSSNVRYILTDSDIAAQSVTLVLPAASVLQVASAPAVSGLALNARIEDQGGNVSLLSNNFNVNLDTNIAPPVVDTTRGAALGVSKAQASKTVYLYGSGVEAGAQVSVYFTGALGTTLLSTSTGGDDGSFTVALQPNDLTSLGEGPVSYRLVQTDVALNTSADTVGSFNLLLSTPLPTLLSMTDDNVVNAAEAVQTSTTYRGLGLAGATVNLGFYVRDSVTGLYKTTAEFSRSATVGSDGFWSVALSAADFTALSAAGQGAVQIKALQTEIDGTDTFTSGEATMEFYVDRQAPQLLASANLFSSTQNFENSVWTKGNATVLANASTAPDSTQTADAFVINSGSFNAGIRSSVAITAGQTYTYSFYLKNGSLGTPWVELTTSGDAIRRQWFDTSNGTVGSTTDTTGTLKAKSMTDAGNGWWRASVSFTATATTNETFTISTRPANGNSGNVTGNGYSPAVYLWGAQLEVAPSASAYIRVDIPIALSLFDGNGDGANKDGLLVTFAEAVALSELIKTTAYTPTSGKTMGTDFRIEAVDSRAINGRLYATQFKLFLDSDSTLVQGDTITISQSSVIDAGGNVAAAKQVLTIPNISVPGQAIPPLDIMDDNRINADEAADVTRLTYSDSNTPAQLLAARGGSLQTKLDGVVIEQALPKANFLTLDLTLSKAVKLLEGQQITSRVKVTYLDNSFTFFTVYATGTPKTQTTATTAYRFTSQQPADLANISSISYDSSDLSGFLVPQTVDPTGATTSGLKITGNNVSLTLDFPNTVFLTNGLNSAVTVNLYINSVGTSVTLNSVGTTGTAGGVTRLVYTGTASGTPDANKNNYPNSVPTNLTLEPGVTGVTGITVITTGAGAPVTGTRYDTSVAVKTADLRDGAVMTTQLLDASGNAVAGTLDTLSYTSSNPNRVLYTQTLLDALSAAGRKLQMFVDGKAVGTPTTLGISTINMTLGIDWENQYGNGGGLGGASAFLQPGATMTATVTVTLKSVDGRPAEQKEVLVTFVAPGGVTQPRINKFDFSGAFVDQNGAAIDASTVASMAYKPGSISQLHPNLILGSTATFTASQYVDLPASAWAGQTEGLKQLTAQTTTADGSLTSVFSAPKQIRLDMSVGSIKDVTLLTDANNNGTLDAGDTLQLRFSENVNFGAGALPASFGSNPVLTAVGGEAGYSQLWNVKLGTGASLAAGQSFTLKAGQVFDQAGNDNANVTVSATVPASVMSRAGTPLIDNVSDDNVITRTDVATMVNVNLSKALAGDTVRLLLDGVEVGSQQVLANGAASVSFSVAGSAWGADGERQLTTVLTRGSGSNSVSSTSALRSVYVAADSNHWSQESSYAGKVHWFNPDAIVAADGSTVSTWAASTGGMTVANTTTGKTIKMVDALTGHAYLVTDASSVFYETALANGQYVYQQANATPTLKRSATDTDPLLATAGFTDFSMFKPTLQGGQTLMVHPYYRYTSNTADVKYGTPSVTVKPYTPLLRPIYLAYSFSETGSTVTMGDNPLWGPPSMTNSASVGSWQMVTAAVSGYAMEFYNQMSLTTSGNVSNYTPSATRTLADMDISTKATSDLNRRFRIGGPVGGSNDGTGILGDQIDVTALTKLAYQQEIGAYLAAKYQSTGSVVARNAVLTNTSYDLSLSNVPGTLIDQSLQLNDARSNDTVLVAGADYVNSAAGDDVVKIKDLAFRHLDGGQGSDTLMLAPGFTGRSVIVLADMVSNYRGLSGSPAADNRVNDAGYHRLLGFEKIDLVQDGETSNRRQVLTVSASDVNALSETNTLALRLGQEDVVKATGFANNQGVSGIYQVNGSWYDNRYTQTVAGQSVNLYTSGGDRLPEAVSFTSSASNQVQINFDHAMFNSVVAGHFSVTTYPGSSLFVSSALSVNLRQGVALTFSGALNVAAKITYSDSGTLADEAGRGFGHKTWLLGTGASDTLNGATLSTSEQASGVTFLGGGGADYITGTSGADLISGGLGADVLTGGNGSDTFYYRNELAGSGAAGSLGGSAGDVITDFNFNAADPSQNDRIDLSSLFDNVQFVPTGNASTDATRLDGGGFLQVRKVTNFQTNKQDLQLWVDRDGGGLYGQLATISNGGSNLTSDYPAVESNQEFLTRLLDQGRLVVSHF